MAVLGKKFRPFSRHEARARRENKKAGLGWPG
jgi:hypothetical protein